MEKKRTRQNRREPLFHYDHRGHPNTASWTVGGQKLYFVFVGNIPALFWGLGHWTRANAELCLLATKGSPKRQSARVHQIVMTPVEAHSKKPDVVRDKIVALAGDVPRIELFARQATPGWDVWGNEVDSSVSFL